MYVIDEYIPEACLIVLIERKYNKVLNFVFKFIAPFNIQLHILQLNDYSNSLKFKF